MKLTEAQLRNIIRKEIRLMFEVKNRDEFGDLEDEDSWWEEEKLSRDEDDYEPEDREEERSYGDMGPGPRGRTAPYGGAEPGRLRGKMEESRRTRRRR